MKNQENFVNYLKVKFKPKIDEEKRKEIIQRMEEQNTKRLKKEVDLKKIGEDYL